MISINVAEKYIAISSLKIIFLHEPKCPIFITWSNITYIVSKEFDGGKYVMKSIEIKNYN